MASGMRTGVDGPINITLDSSSSDDEDDQVDVPNTNVAPELPLAIAYAVGESPPSTSRETESSVLQIPNEPTGKVWDQSMIALKGAGVQEEPQAVAEAEPMTPLRASFQPPAITEPDTPLIFTTSDHHRRSTHEHSRNSSDASDPPVSPSARRRATDQMHKPGLRNSHTPRGPDDVPQGIVHPTAPAPAPVPPPVSSFATDSHNVEEPPVPDPKQNIEEPTHYPTPSKRKVDQPDGNKGKKVFLGMAGLAVVVIVVVVVVFVVVLKPDPDPSESTPIPTTMAPTNTEPTPGPVEPTALGSTEAPTTQSEALWTELVEGTLLPLNVTQPNTLLQDGNSPQARAANWVLDDMIQKQISPGDNPTQVVQRYALATLHYATKGDEWESSNSWLSEDEECSWPYVTCDQEGRVEVLDFPSAATLQGELPRELSLLTELKGFLAPNNFIQGSLEDPFFALASLEHLVVPFNNFNGSLPMGFFQRKPNIIGLQLQGNDFTGTIPESLYDLSTLKYLHLANNTNLGGTLDSKIGQLGSLALIDTGNTNMEGSIPEELYQLNQLAEIYLENSKMTGQLSEDIGLLHATLVNLHLHDNSFSGPLPQSLDQMTALESLWLTGNSLTGTISNVVCAERGVGYQKLFELHADCNIVTNCNDEDCPTRAPTVAPTLAPTTATPTSSPTRSPTSAPIATSAPTISPTASSKTNAPTTTPATLPPIPAPTTFEESLPDYTRVALLDPTSPQSLGIKWVLGHPRFNFIPDWKRRQFFALATFYYSYDGPNWSNAEQENWLSFDTDECSWGDQGDESNECNAEGRITKLSFEEQTNQPVKGETPPEIALLSSLQKFEVFSLSLETNLEGVLPSQLSKLTDLSSVRLTFLQLRGSIPLYLGDFKQLTSLNIRSNQIGGQIPTQIGLMSNLRFLTMYDNYLQGSIPTQMALLPLESLVIYGNFIKGTFPADICALSSLSNIKLDCLDLDYSPECDVTCSDPDDEPAEPVPLAPTASPVSMLPTSAPLPLACLGPTIPAESGLLLTLHEFSEAALSNPTSPQSLAYDWLSSHALLNTFPDWRKQQLFAMATFYYAFNGERWGTTGTENEDWLEERVEECEWGDGGESANVCDEEGRIEEFSIEFAANFVGSSMPPEMALLTSLKELKVHDNGHQAELETMIPTQLACLASLNVLHLFDNELSGFIPDKLFNMTSLSNLFLNENQLTGTLPTKFGLLTNLQYLTLYDNLFTGIIPSEVGLLTALESLLVHQTRLTGTVPDEVCFLFRLHSLGTFRVNCDMVTCPAACGCTGEGGLPCF